MHDEDTGGSPACFLHELVGGQPVDPETARDVARFRKAERARLIAARLALPIDTRTRMAEAICAELAPLIPEGAILGVYWPIKGELDLRPLMASAHARGVRVALPVVIEKARPLVFRPWLPHCRMTRGVWNIPVPDTEDSVIPTVVISPVVGTADNYRLGYGGGFYDRTLASFDPRPLVIGIGPSVAAIPTIFPQPWDIPMDRVILVD